MSSFESLLEHYKTLGVEPGADLAAIRKAFTKRSLETHPDKHPDDPHAADKFDAVRKAYDALADSSLRAEFEQKLAARAAAAARFKEMDESKRKMKEVLEMREKAAAARSKATSKTAGPSSYASDIAKLRQEGRDRVEMAAVEARRRTRELETKSSDFSLRCTVRAKWPQDVNEAAGKDAMPDSHGKVITTLSEEQLEVMFSRYGEVLTILARKPHSACIAFAKPDAAHAACASPPPQFTVTSFTSEQNGDTAPAVAGVKRPRSSMTGADATEPEPASEKLSLEAHEARVWAKIAARKAAQIPPMHAHNSDIDMR